MIRDLTTGNTTAPAPKWAKKDLQETAASPADWRQQIPRELPHGGLHESETERNRPGIPEMQSDDELNARAQYVSAVFLAGGIGSREELKRAGGGRKKEAPWRWGEGGRARFIAEWKALVAEVTKGKCWEKVETAGENRIRCFCHKWTREMSAVLVWSVDAGMWNPYNFMLQRPKINLLEAKRPRTKFHKL